VATLEPAPEHLKEKLPPIIININREEVIAWAQPRSIKKDQQDYHAYPWRRLSRSLLYLYAHHQKQNHQKIDFPGSNLALSTNKSQTPAGFQFGAGGKEESFQGSPEDKASWDYWLMIAHAVAAYFHLKPALLRPTWIDRIALYFYNTGRITEGELKRFKEVALFMDDLILRGEP
jgi:hypothetical protein